MTVCSFAVHILCMGFGAGLGTKWKASQGTGFRHLSQCDSWRRRFCLTFVGKLSVHLQSVTFALSFGTKWLTQMFDFKGDAEFPTLRCRV